jgi:hypothetical protein
MKNTILGFCGVKPVKITSIGSVKTSNLVQRQKWLKKVDDLGRECL